MSAIDNGQQNNHKDSQKKAGNANRLLRFGEIEQDRGSITPTKDAIGEKEKIEKYGWFSRLPAALKSGVIKWWFAGAACYFVMWGLTGFMDELDAVAILGLTIGLLFSLIAFPFLKYTDGEKQDIHKYIFFDYKFKNKPLEVFARIFSTALYTSLVCFAIMLIYGLINVMLDKNNSYFAVEPILFGLFFIIIDFAAVGAANGLRFLAKTLKKKG